MKKEIIFGAVIALLSLASCSSNCNENEQATSAQSFDEVLSTRRSVRSYDDSKKISEAEVRELLKATQEAPSWANQQPTKYYVAISEEKLTAVQDMVGGNKERIKDAPYSSFPPSNVASLAFSKVSRPTRSVTVGVLTTRPEQLLPDSEGKSDGI